MRTFALMMAFNGALALSTLPVAGASGFRGDGTGVWPADCAPVTQWNEVDLKEEGTGKEKKLVPDRENRQNIVWKTPVQSACNGGMILVRGKLYLLQDRGGYEYATRWAPDFVGSRLVCLDPKDGKVSWQKDYDHLPADADKERKDVLDYYQWWTRTFGPYARWYNAARMHGGQPVRTDEDKQAYAVAAKEAIAAGVPVPATYGELQASAAWSKVAKTYVQCAWWGLEPKLFSERASQHKRLIALGYPRERWFGQPSFIGVNMATPVSDSNRIYFTTGHYDAFCVDMDGKLVWSTWIKEPKPQGMFGAPAVPSPILTEDRLVGVWGDNHAAWLRGLDRQSCKVVWSASPSSGWTSMEKLLVPVGNTGKFMEVIWHGGGGKVYRAHDGKLLLDKIGQHASGRPQGVAGNILVIGNGWVDGGNANAITYPKGLVAVRFTAENEDALQAEVLWAREDLRWGPTVNGAVVYTHGRNSLETLDLTTGKTISKIEKLPFEVHHMTSLAGQHLFGFDNSGSRCLVVTAGNDLQLVGTNRLGRGAGMFNQGGQPFFSGNRIFYRSYTDVYCLGNPAESLRLSKEHQ